MYLTKSAGDVVPGAHARCAKQTLHNGRCAENYDATAECWCRSMPPKKLSEVKTNAGKTGITFSRAESGLTTKLAVYPYRAQYGSEPARTPSAVEISA